MSGPTFSSQKEKVTTIYISEYGLGKLSNSSFVLQEIERAIINLYLISSRLSQISRKRKKMSKELGDWMCGSCHHNNFRKRESCQRCGAHKYSGGGTNGLVIMAGDWYCNVINCGAHNFANRPSCHQCGEYRVDNYGLDSRTYSTCDDHGIGLPGWKNGDWMCTRVGCGAHNYASRMECYKCATSKRSN